MTTENHRRTNLPRSLYLLLVSFAARNVTHIESLLGFPDQVGHDIFKQVERLGILQSPHEQSQKCLQLFQEAYPHLVLIKLNLTSATRVVDEYFDHLSQFTCLTELSLAACRLGDQHDMLQNIAQILRLHRMTHLSLEGNCLTDAGLQKLTSPLRMYERGHSSLTYLDLSGNEFITDVGVKCIATAMRNLQTLLLTGTSVKDSGLATLCGRLRLRRAGCPPQPHAFTDEGWAVATVNDWSHLCSQQHSSSSSSTSTASSFYRRRKAADVTSHRCQLNHQSHDIIVLIRDATDREVLPSASQPAHSSCTNSDTTLDAQPNMSAVGCSSPPALLPCQHRESRKRKRACKFHPRDIPPAQPGGATDDELLAMYRQAKKTGEGKDSLWNAMNSDTW
ncbi:PREDICTED: leucine-rich repeat-containing protein 42-like [Priapulus caudatus]|uniref:Leucine-rich repeat-containing protein 42 n=1 Tax=Priapulus caudatus TaxID=37621 RepID=A0ABM1E7D9_PRICU|nr:PREDICTED: leucine-rich repeat-containing protein 42-like [Priapulus caudatus]